MIRSRLTIRAIALFLVLSGSVPIRAWAQQPPVTPVESPGAQTAAPAGPHGVDRYDVGAAAANVLWLPFKAGVCGISAGLGAMVFLVTLGAARGWSESAFDEGCIENWLITGADLRPMPESGAYEVPAAR